MQQTYSLPFSGLLVPRALPWASMHEPVGLQTSIHKIWPLSCASSRCEFPKLQWFQLLRKPKWLRRLAAVFQRRDASATIDGNSMLGERGFSIGNYVLRIAINLKQMYFRNLSTKPEGLLHTSLGQRPRC